MGRDSRLNEQNRLAVIEQIRGHDSTVVHGFNYTAGSCPKCGNQRHLMRWCAPGVDGGYHVPGCEVDGEHLHRICGACQYAWVERCLDQALAADKEGFATAEIELAQALVVIVEQAGGVRLDLPLVSSRARWKILFERDFEKRLLTLSVAPPDPPAGRPVHPTIPEGAIPQ